MIRFDIQMIDHGVSTQWWKKIMRHFARAGDSFEIRCWREEISEIENASWYGVSAEDSYEVSIKGIVTDGLLKEWLTEEPTDKTIYNKMTKYFTIHVENDLYNLWSEHYGTEMAIVVTAEKERVFLEQVMGQYPEAFSVGIVDEAG
ncbi:MAG TPA: hypothetical protein H9749_07660 [Candidatus Acutalibacter stercorigallinarum]|nr:hypothetical protein [Candidatus Acutalibacter stercorigallinarum]